MADSNQYHQLIETIVEDGCRFNFFKAVWLLERLTEGYEPVGDRGPVGREAFRFRPALSIGFPPTDVRKIIKRVNPEDGRDFYQMEVTFLGLYGVSTPLPLHYAVNILRQVHTAHVQNDPGAALPTVTTDEHEGTPTRDFLDVFHHRVVSLFYRAWLKYRYHLQYGLKGRDSISDYMRWLIGISPTHDAGDYGVAPTRMIRYAGNLIQRPRSASMLEGILRDYWQGLAVKVEQCVGRWVSIATQDMNRIGQRNSRLGMDLTIGEEIYDLNGMFNIVIGPVDWVVYQAFLPDGPAFAETRSIVRLFCTDPLSFNLEVVLEADSIPELALGGDEHIGRLGYTSWARTDPIGETSIIIDGQAEPSMEQGVQAEPEAPDGVLAAF
ncbi:MAG: type VI secretion system baseplate subunit TssG [Planctomycetota bacterium]|jgi:type VI secretion system protein ImpH